MLEPNARISYIQQKRPLINPSLQKYTQFNKHASLPTYTFLNHTSLL